MVSTEYFSILLAIDNDDWSCDKMNLCKFYEEKKI